MSGDPEIGTVAAEARSADGEGPWRLLVESVDRKGSEVTYVGVITGGPVRVGERARAALSGSESVVRTITVGAREVTVASPGSTVTLHLADELSVDAGEVLAASQLPPEVADQFEVDVIWTGDADLVPGRHYTVRLGASTVSGTLSHPKYRVDSTTAEHLAAKTLSKDQVGVCVLSLDRRVAFEPYETSPALGGFTVLERQTGEVFGTGLIKFALRRSQNIHWQHVEVTKAARCALNNQRPAVLWFTGLSGAGKSTIANLVERQLHASGARTYLLDGDNVRHGLNRDLGFTDADRIENMRRVSEVAKLMVDAGLIVIASFISPFRDERDAARAMFEPSEFVEIFVDAPLEVAEARDRKGLYAKARSGRLKNFTGIDSPYEPPTRPELLLNTVQTPPIDNARRVLGHLRDAGISPHGT